jgi:flavodoxin
MSSPENGNVKALVIYYSYDDSTKIIAEEISDTVDGDILRLVPVEGQSASRVRYIWDDRSVDMDPRPALENFDLSVQDYNLIFLGTPVWAMSYAPPLETFLASVDIREKNIALFCTHEGLRGIVFEELIKRLSDNKILGTVEFYDPVGSGVEYAAKAAANWARKVLESARQ